MEDSLADSCQVLAILFNWLSDEISRTGFNCGRLFIFGLSADYSLAIIFVHGQCNGYLQLPSDNFSVKVFLFRIRSCC